MSTTITRDRFVHHGPTVTIDLWVDPADDAVMIRQRRRALVVCSQPTSYMDGRTIDLLIDWLQTARATMAGRDIAAAAAAGEK